MAKEPETMWDFFPEGISDVRLEFASSTGMDSNIEAQWLGNISQALARGMSETAGIQTLQGQFSVEPGTNAVSLTMTVAKPFNRPKPAAVPQQEAPQEIEKTVAEDQVEDQQAETEEAAATAFPQETPPVPPGSQP